MSRSASGESSSSGRPLRTLAEALVDLECEDRRRLQLLRVRSARLVPAAGQQLLRERLEGAQPLVLVVDERERSEAITES